MMFPFTLLRLLRIYKVLLKHGLNPYVAGSFSPWLRRLSYLNPFRRHENKTRGESVRQILEELGPIYVKFGQMLSTRRDILPDDIAEELTKLQDQVPPFDGKIAKVMIEKEHRQPIEEIFASFDIRPLASASIAQVHSAELHDGSKVIVKVLRPHIYKTIKHDISLLYLGAKLVYRFWKHGERLKPVEFIAEFEQTILGELDLMREAANASQLRRNFLHSEKLYIPKIYWEYCHRHMIVMERIHGIRINDHKKLKAAKVDFEELARRGVEIFFTQVLRDSFFHADMHPGNFFVDVSNPKKPKYIAIDFGIVGSLSPQDQGYIASNMLAFFKRDYRQVAISHVESGWIPADTRIDQFEAAIRTVSEPIFEKPLKDVSFGHLLLRLFQTAEQFNMNIQPQLFLLQKTLLSVEGMGRQVYPDLDLWTTAQPILEKWVRKQHGIRHVAQTSLANLSGTTEAITKSPALIYKILSEYNYFMQIKEHNSSKKLKNPHSQDIFLGLGIGLVISFAISHFVSLKSILPWQWSILGLGGLLILTAWFIPRR